MKDSSELRIAVKENDISHSIAVADFSKARLVFIPQLSDPIQDHFEQKIDWIDISIDGTEDIHNLQRNNGEAHQVAIKGIEKGREVAKRVTSLFTVTSINYNNVYDACLRVIDMVDEFHITPVSPVRPEIMFTETSKKEFQDCWKHIANLQSKYTDKVFVRMYRHEDLVKVANINPTAFAEAFSKPVGVSQGRIIIQFEGVTFSYLPKSLSINETIVVDSDDW
jgi:sulfatase maturation enzyme AslB (radical SAM superfamily)